MSKIIFTNNTTETQTVLTHQSLLVTVPAGSNTVLQLNHALDITTQAYLKKFYGKYPGLEITYDISDYPLDVKDNSTESSSDPSTGKKASELIVGNKYKMGTFLDKNSNEVDAEWYVVDYDKSSNIAILQSTGIYGGWWPGYKLNASYCADDYSYKDISWVYATSNPMYNYFAVDGWSGICADTEKGFYFVDKDTAATGVYNLGLTEAATRHQLFALCSIATSWTGTPYEDVENQKVYTYFVNSDGNVYYRLEPYAGIQFNPHVYAPAFQIDASKIEVVQDLIKMKSKPFMNVGQKLKMGTTVDKDGNEMPIYWYVASYDEKNNKAVLQSTGIQSGKWPGYVANGNSFVSDSYIDRDISELYGTDSQLYKFYVTDGWGDICVEKEKGLYLISKDDYFGYRLIGLREAASRYELFGVNASHVWVGTVYKDHNAYVGKCVSKNVVSLCKEWEVQLGTKVIAPSIDIDTSKIEILNGEIIKK